MLIPRVITRVNRNSVGSGKLTIPLSYDTIRSSSNLYEAEPEKPPRKLKEWRINPEAEYSNLKAFDAPLPKGKKLVLPRQQFKLASVEIQRWWSAQSMNYLKYDQRFIAQRHETLGCDLAAAHFLVHRGGKVKFYGQTDWKVKDENGAYELPGKYDDSWQLTHVDASGVALYYEGMENFQNLRRLSWADFSKNPHLNDWCLDRMPTNFPFLEYLNISECKSVTERGLEAICKLHSLKTLIITDWDRKPSFELACAMLEDCSPGLTVKIKEPEKNCDEKKEQT